jgi:hypothetical protein
MTDRIIRFPLDIDAIAARAQAAPGGRWEAFTDRLWIDWRHPGDDEYEPGDWCESGRWIGIHEQPWHTGTGSDNPPPELWDFLAAARADVLALAAEVQRLRARLAAASRPAPMPLRAAG